MALVMLGLLCACFVLFPIARVYQVHEPGAMKFSLVVFDELDGYFLGFGPVINFSGVGSMDVYYIDTTSVPSEYDLIPGLFLGNMMLYFVLVGLTRYYYRRA